MKSWGAFLSSQCFLLRLFQDHSKSAEDTYILWLGSKHLRSCLSHPASLSVCSVSLFLTFLVHLVLPYSQPFSFFQISVILLSLFFFYFILSSECPPPPPQTHTHISLAVSLCLSFNRIYCALSVCSRPVRPCRVGSVWSKNWVVFNLVMRPEYYEILL